MVQEIFRSRSAPVASDGRLADNIVYFARALRKAGITLFPYTTLFDLKSVV